MWKCMCSSELFRLISPVCWQRRLWFQPLFSSLSGVPWGWLFHVVYPLHLLAILPGSWCAGLQHSKSWDSRSWALSSATCCIGVLTRHIPDHFSSVLRLFLSRVLFLFRLLIENVFGRTGFPAQLCLKRQVRKWNVHSQIIYNHSFITAV